MNSLELSLAVVGGCVLFAYPTEGPTAWLREGLRWLIRRACLRITGEMRERYVAETILDCVKCQCAWAGLVVGLRNDCWWIALTAPAIAWLGLQFTGGKIR